MIHFQKYMNPTILVDHQFVSRVILLETRAAIRVECGNSSKNLNEECDDGSLLQMTVAVNNFK